MRLNHGSSNIPDTKFIFGSDFPGSIIMNVMPGSKIANLVPYAVKKFQNGECDEIIWWSKHGAVAKTVACAEMFKRIVSNSISQTSQSNVDANQPEVYQCSRLHLQSCNCSVPDTTITCTLEEPGIAILFSKSPFPGEDCQLPVDFGGSSFADFVDKGVPSNSNLDYPHSRRRLSRTTRKKRDTPRECSKNKTKCTDNNSSETGDFQNVPFQTPRLASAISNVNKVLKHKKLNRKRKKILKL
ncbi:hypothetical protein MN116_001811 [Schistosoma mekongi]|uniref:DNA/RNA-binding protein Alba-like domain-containing protein n=1 Tax=Schistosoma mekongi TaxID=38744 RepID=A0AAE1ZI35_SCHME|nr:hypothetical protein MN116_001811 [Schistosoma mekongi]